jgi:hypothetical protein
MTDKQTPVETEVGKIDLNAIREELGLGVALDVGIHSALTEAHKPKETDGTD